MEEQIHLAYLYDFYGDLLKPGQKDIFYSFVFDDLSLQEIADERGISRQAVHDRVTRCIHAMEEYEEKLHLIEKYTFIEKSFSDIKEYTRKSLDDRPGVIADIDKTLDSILERL